MRWPADGGRLSNAGGEGSPTLSSSTASVPMETTERRSDELMEGKLRRTPTWRAKCRMWGSGKPLRFEHWDACEVFSSHRSMP